LFWSGQVLDDLYERVKRSIDNPLSAVFVSAMSECKKSNNNIKHLFEHTIFIFF